MLDGSVVNIALPHIGRDLDAPLGGLQWTVNGYLLPLAAFVLIGGALGDRFGRRRTFLLGVVWFTGASVLCGLAPNIGLLIAARVLQGCGSALLTPGSLSLIQTTLREEDRARAIGLWAGLGGVAAAGGPLVGGYLIDALNWRWIFFINVPLALICILVTVRCVPESRDAEVKGRFDITGSALVAAGLGAITYALVERTWWAGLIGLVAMIAFVLRERRTPNPIMPTSMFRSTEFSVINLNTLLIYGAFGGLTFFLILQLQEVAGFSALEAGAATIPMTVIMLFGAGRAGGLSRKIGARLPIGIGATVAAAGFLLLIPVGAGSTYWRDVFGPVVIIGLGITLLVAPLTATVLAAAPNHLSGVASGINNAVARSGSLLAVAALPLVAGLSGTEYDNPVALSHAYKMAIEICAGLMLLAAALAFMLLPSYRKSSLAKPTAPEPRTVAAANCHLDGVTHS